MRAQRPAFDQRPHRFLDEQRSSAGARDDQGAQFRIGRAVAKQGTNQLSGRVAFKRIEMHFGEAVLAVPSRLVFRAAGQYHQQAAGCHGFHQALDHVMRLDVGPLHVLEP